MILFNQDVYLLYLGRILGGLALGLCSPPAGVYVTEITTAEWRTTFGGGLSAAYMVGMVLVFIVGKVGTVTTNDKVDDIMSCHYVMGCHRYAILTYCDYPDCPLQHVHWRVLSGLCCVFPLLSLVLMFFIPESPAWLVTQGQTANNKTGKV